jgi:hypothetical protein
MVTSSSSVIEECRVRIVRFLKQGFWPSQEQVVMDHPMTKVTQEEAIESSLPTGYKSTFLESDRIRRLNNADLSLLGDTVAEYDGKTLTETDIIENTAQRFLTQFLTPERTLEFPGLALCLNDDNRYLEKWAARYKADNDTPSGTIKDPARAGTDDIVFSFCTPEVWSEVSGTAVSNFHTTGLNSGDTLEVVGDAGVDHATNQADTSLSLDSDEYLFFTGDFIDMSGGQSIVTATQLSDVDGEDFGPVNAVFSGRLSGAHMITTQGTYATASVDIDAKVYEGGDTELVPIAWYLGPGTKAPSLV